MLDKAFNKYFLAFFYIPDQYKTQEMYRKIISDNPFSMRYVPDQCKTQQMCDKAFDDSLAALKFVTEWVFVIYILTILTLVTLIMIKFILILLFMKNLWLGIMNLKNAKHLKVASDTKLPLAVK